MLRIWWTQSRPLIKIALGKMKVKWVNFKNLKTYLFKYCKTKWSKKFSLKLIQITCSIRYWRVHMKYMLKKLMIINIKLRYNQIQRVMTVLKMMGIRITIRATNKVSLNQVANRQLQLISRRQVVKTSPTNCYVTASDLDHP